MPCGRSKSVKGFARDSRFAAEGSKAKFYTLILHSRALLGRIGRVLAALNY
jgi:hypothetical protein